MLQFRDIHPNEDDQCGLLLANAYLAVWNHNWFQNLQEPLEPAELDGTIRQSWKDLPSLNHARAIFYRFLIRLTRQIGGLALVAVETGFDPGVATTSSVQETIVAVILYHPPRVEYELSLANFGGIPQALKQLYDAGILEVLRHYGFDSFRRVNVVFQGSVKEATQKGLANKGLMRKECGFIQILAVHNLHRGRGYGRKLLQWVLEKHFQAHRTSPVVLDTTTEQAAKSYRQLSFEEIETFRFPGDYDQQGFPLPKSLTKAERKQAKLERYDVCYGRIMVRMPLDTC